MSRPQRRVGLAHSRPSGPDLTGEWWSRGDLNPCPALQRRLWRFRVAERLIAEHGLDRFNPVSDRPGPLARTR